LIGRPVYPLGDADRGHGIIAMDEGGCAYIDYMHVAFVTGPGLDALMSRALLGLRPPPECVLRDNPMFPISRVRSID
jgi:hypothetical protein